MAKEMNKEMKGFFLILVFLVSLFTISSTINALTSKEVKLNSYVNDYANVIDDNLEKEIYEFIDNLEKQTTAEIAVLTIDTTEGEPIRDYAISIAHGVVGKEGKDNGILIVLAVQDRQWDIEIGYGLEGILNDAKVGRIGRDLMVPLFKEGKFGEGLFEGVKEIGKIITNQSEYDYEAGAETNLFFFIFSIIMVLLPIIIFIIVFVVAIRQVKKKNKEKKMSDAAFWTAVFAASQLNSGKGKKGSSGGGFGGGFGGFGGGGFGGGGASGSF